MGKGKTSSSLQDLLFGYLAGNHRNNNKGIGNIFTKLWKHECSSHLGEREKCCGKHEIEASVSMAFPSSPNILTVTK